LLAVGQLSFLAKLLMEEPGSKISTVDKVAHQHVHQDPGDDQPEGSVAGQQEGVFT